MRHIKSSDTKSPVANSRKQMEDLLRRYGAVGFGVQQEFSDTGVAEHITVQFIIPDRPGSKARIPVAIPVNVIDVLNALYKTRANLRDRSQWERAERVAWRNLLLWVDSTLAAASIGLQSITEAFYAHNVIKLEDGRTARLSEVIEAAQGKLPPGVRALLASPAETIDA